MPTCHACLRAHVPKCFACLAFLRAHLPMCLARLRAHVPTCFTCLRANVPCVCTCSRANVLYVLTCQCALRVYVLICKRIILNNVKSYIIQICYLYLGLERGNIGETFVSLLGIFTSSSVVFRSLGGLKMFVEKNLGKYTMYIGIAVMPRLCCPIFHFHQF